MWCLVNSLTHYIIVFNTDPTQSVVRTFARNTSDMPRRTWRWRISFPPPPDFKRHVVQASCSGGPWKAEFERIEKKWWRYVSCSQRQHLPSCENCLRFDQKPKRINRETVHIFSVISVHKCSYKMLLFNKTRRRTFFKYLPLFWVERLPKPIVSKSDADVSFLPPWGVSSIPSVYSTWQSSR